MEDTSRKDIRRILKSFGIRTDEALVAHLAQNPDTIALRIRITLEDLTNYGDVPPEIPLHIVVEDVISR